MPVEFDRGSPGKFDSRTLNRKTLSRWTGRKTKSLWSKISEVLGAMSGQVRRDWGTSFKEAQGDREMCGDSGGVRGIPHIQCITHTIYYILYTICHSHVMVRPGTAWYAQSTY